MAPGLLGTGKIDQADNLTVGPGQRRSALNPQTSTWQSRNVEKYEAAGTSPDFPHRLEFDQKYVAKS